MVARAGATTRGKRLVEEPIMFVAPRALNEPVSWSLRLSSTRAPTRRPSSPAGSNGVFRTRPEITLASSTSAW